MLLFIHGMSIYKLPSQAGSAIPLPFPVATGNYTAVLLGKTQQHLPILCTDCLKDMHSLFLNEVYIVVPIFDSVQLHIEFQLCGFGCSGESNFE